MNEFIVTAPVAKFSGESAGVVFKDGVGRVDDSTKEGRAAIEYFRRRGYTLTREGADEPQDAEQETPDTGDDPFDPSKHNADEVITYLDTLDRGTEKGGAEFDRIVRAELQGKNRKTITDKEKEAAA